MAADGGTRPGLREGACLRDPRGALVGSGVSKSGSPGTQLSGPIGGGILAAQEGARGDAHCCLPRRAC